MRFLTTDNAELYVGAEIDCTIRRGYHYPLIVGKWESGRYYVKDAVGTCIPVPRPEDFSNRIRFDIVR